MKQILKTLALLFVLSFMLTLGSCEMFINWFGTTIEGRVEAFNEDLKAERWSQLYKHFHTDTVDRTEMKNDPISFWSNTSIYHADSQIVDYSSEDTVTGIVYNGTTNLSFSMDMKTDGMEYFIRTLEISGFPDIRKLD